MRQTVIEDEPVSCSRLVPDRSLSEHQPVVVEHDHQDQSLAIGVQIDTSSDDQKFLASPVPAVGAAISQLGEIR
ncbi:hypothetical protein WL43_21885 [Burkholderia ubonensis]|nr:hypothetical protein WL43_21885 [Burkholderia ubonensis]